MERLRSRPLAGATQKQGSGKGLSSIHRQPKLASVFRAAKLAFVPVRAINRS